VGLLILKRLAHMQTYPTSRKVREKMGHPADDRHRHLKRQSEITCSPGESLCGAALQRCGSGLKGEVGLAPTKRKHA